MRTRRGLLKLGLGVVMGPAVQAQRAAAGPPTELIVCGAEEVFVIRPHDAEQPTRKLWSWTAAGAAGLPERMHSMFRSTDDCKPLDGGKRILVTSSSNGIAIVRRDNKHVDFWAEVRNAHSAEMLPGNRIVVAGSTGENGNRLVLYDEASSGRELQSIELYSGHGVSWDAKREILWALGGNVLRAYSLSQWDSDQPRLSIEREFRLPESGGHDLSPSSDGVHLHLSTSRRCWLFDRDEREFLPHPDLANVASVKSISEHPGTDHIVFTRAQPGGYWTDTLDFLRPDGKLRLEGERIYKVRWSI